MGRTAQRLLFNLLIATMAISLGGCAHWSTREQTESELEDAFKIQSATLAPNRVVLEVAHVTIDREDVEELESVWRGIDEQVLDPSLRKSLNENGVRIGRIGGELPAYLRVLVSQSNAHPDPAVAGSTESGLQLHLMTMTAGADKELPIGKSQDSLSLLRNEDGAIRGRTLSEAQCMLTMRVENETSSGMLFFQPWIVYGPVKQTYRGKDGAWTIAPEREQVDFPDLHFSSSLAPGETLVIAPIAEARGVGKLFFHEKDGSRRILLVRLANSQGSPLFQTPDIVPPPISSLTE